MNNNSKEEESGSKYHRFLVSSYGCISWNRGCVFSIDVSWRLKKNLYGNVKR